jgi:hypothetical protein
MIRALLLLLFLLPARGDITLRYAMDLVPGPGVPPDLLARLKAEMKQSQPDLFDQGMVYVFTDDGWNYTRNGSFVLIFDPETQLQNVLLTSKKVYASMAAAEWQRIQGSKKSDLEKIAQPGALTISSDRTNRSKRVLNIYTEERRITMKFSMPRQGLPEGAQTTLSFWCPTPGEIERVPALRRLEELTQSGLARFSPAQQIAEAFGSNPQMAANLLMLSQEMSQVGIYLEMRLATILPGLQPEEIKTDSPSPLMEIVYTLKELSDAKAPRHYFQIPEGYRKVEIEEIIGQASAP